MKMLKEILKRVKLKTLIILLMLLMFNAYAWFVYSTRVSGKISTRIESWDVTFQAGQEETITNINVDIESIYPGMEPYKQEITASNLGEKPATLSYVIREITILGETYTAEEGGKTTDELAELIKSDDYPFRISILFENNGVLEAGTGRSTITISVIWPFEQDDDELDTYWGELAHEYYKENSDKPSISLKIELKATQSI